jgi:WD40 repeat protein
VVLVDSESLQVVAKSRPHEVGDFAWSPAGDRIVTTSIGSVTAFGFKNRSFATVPNVTRRLNREAACIHVDWLPSGELIAMMRRNDLALCQPETLEDVSVANVPMLASIHFRSDDDLAAVGGIAQTAIVRDGDTIDRHSFPAQHGGRPQVAWHPDGMFLATGANGMVSITDKNLAEIFRIGANNHVAGVAGVGQTSTCVVTQNGKVGLFGSDGALAGQASVSQGSLRTLLGAILLERSRRLFLRPAVGTRFEMQLPVDRSQYRELMQSTDSAPMFSVVSDEILRYDPDEKAWKTFMKDPGQAPGVTVSPDQQRLACLDHDATVKIVSVPQKRILAQWKVERLSGAATVYWHGGSEKLLVTGTKGDVGTIVCIDPETGEELWSAEEPDHDRAVRVVDCNETTILHSGAPFKQRDANTGEIVRQLNWTTQSGIRHQLLCRAPDSRRIQS